MSHNPKTFTVKQFTDFEIPDQKFTLADGESTIKRSSTPTITLENDTYCVYDATYKKSAQETDDILVFDPDSGSYFKTAKWYKETKFKLYRGTSTRFIFAQVETAIASKFFTQLKRTKQTESGNRVTVRINEIAYNFKKFRSASSRVLTMNQLGNATDDPSIKSEQINGSDLKETQQVIDALENGQVTALRAYTDIAHTKYGFGLSKRGALWFIQAPKETNFLLVAHQFIKIFAS